MKIEDNVKVMLTEEQIRARVREIAEQIKKDYAGKEILLVGVLKGAFVFASDLGRCLGSMCDIDFIATSSYGAGTSTTGQVMLLKDLSASIENKDVLIVEDILDTGTTLSYIKRIFGERKPASVKICVFLDKPSRRKADIKADYVGYAIDDLFVVGYGMDYAEKYRMLPYVGVVNEGK